MAGFSRDADRAVVTWLNAASNSGEILRSSASAEDVADAGASDLEEERDVKGVAVVRPLLLTTKASVAWIVRKRAAAMDEIFIIMVAGKEFFLLYEYKICNDSGGAAWLVVCVCVVWRMEQINSVTLE